MTLEQQIPAIDTLPRAYRSYLNSLYNDRTFGTPQIEDLMPYLLDSGSNENRLRQVLEELGTYSMTPERATNPRIRAAWEILGGFTEDHRELFARNNAVISVTGSILYEDPRNLDFDVGIHIPMMTAEINTRTVLFDLADELKDRWSIGPGGELYVVSIEELVQHHTHLEAGDDEYVYKNAWDIMLDFMNMNSIFNGYLGLSYSLQAAEDMRGESARLLQSDVLIQASAIRELRETLRIRKERRGLL